MLANSFIFHENLAGGPDGLAEVRTLDELRGSDGNLTKSDVLLEWKKILDVNFWPIFNISRLILETIPAAWSGDLIARLARAAQQLVERNLTRSHDLTGMVFQRLIADRKFLAAFYTTPASAALLVGLAVTPDTMLSDGEWADPSHVKSLRVADFACGTGTLLSTAYMRISQIHEVFGGISPEIHPAMMAESLVGCDVLPAAAHLTASSLSGAHPLIEYQGSPVFSLPFGRQDNGNLALGSIDLLRDKALLEGFCDYCKSNREYR